MRDLTDVQFEFLLKLFTKNCEDFKVTCVNLLCHGYHTRGNRRRGLTLPAQGRLKTIWKYVTIPPTKDGYLFEFNLEDYLSSDDFLREKERYLKQKYEELEEIKKLVAGYSEA